MSRTGKIARLPQPLREELNHRLENGEPGKALVDWLNSLPEVTALLATHFENRPISEQNLSDWKRGGFVEWQLHRDLLFTAGACAEDSAAYAACGVSAKQFLAILNAHFASNLHHWDGTPDAEPLKILRLLKSLYATVLALRRSEQKDERLTLERDRLELPRAKQAARSSPAPKATPSISTSSEPPRTAVPSPQILPDPPKSSSPPTHASKPPLATPAVPSTPRPAVHFNPPNLRQPSTSKCLLDLSEFCIALGSSDELQALSAHAG